MDDTAASTTAAMRSFRSSGLVVLEVGLNELATKQQNPNVPYGPDEVGVEIASCIRAGATLVHYHDRYDDGTQAWLDVDVSRRTLAIAASQTDTLAYPSYIDGCLDLVWALSDAPPDGYQVQVSPFDPVQHGRSYQWDSATATFSPIRFHADQPEAPGYPPVLDEFAARGIIPNIAVFDSRDLRWTILAAKAGLLRQPLNIKMFFSDRWVSMNEPDVKMLEFLLSRIPSDIEHETVVVPYAIKSASVVEDFQRAALDLGVSFRVGIGDNPEAFPTQTNTELVERAVALLATRGLRPATPAELRQRCLPTPAGVRR